MSNLAVFDRNVIHALGAFSPKAADEGERVYLASIDRHGRGWAERAALRWAEASEKLTPMLAAAARPHGGDHGVCDFIRTRFLNMPDAGKATQGPEA